MISDGNPTAPRCHWTGCGATIRRGHWACESHWWLIPLRLRVALNRAWQVLRRFQGGTELDHVARLHGTRSAAAMRDALEKYRETERAIVSWIATQ